MFLPILKTDGNLANGEIVKMNFVESQKNTHSFGQQIVGLQDGYDYIWQHIAFDYFKVIGKWKESPFSCQ